MIYSMKNYMDLAGHSSYKIEEVEMVIYEWLKMERPDVTELNFTFVIPVCFLLIHTTLLSVRHINLLSNTTISLGYMIRLFSVIIRPY
jgi:hypothetical protein